MNMLYDSESFVVVHLRADTSADTDEHSDDVARLVRHGFEIVDKHAGKQLYLDGAWAELFAQQIQAWQRHMPTQQEVEDTLQGYAQLAQNPVAVH